MQNFSRALATLVAGLRVLLIEGAATEVAAETKDDEADEKEADAFVDKAEIEDDEILGQPALIDHPAGVLEEDWLVYEAFQSVNQSFNEKWRKMWA
jgi:hypothetical protein